jgi:hypothetical protein
MISLLVLLLAAQQNPWITDTVHSKTLGDRSIYVALPDAYATPNTRFPVLICLDAMTRRCCGCGSRKPPMCRTTIAAFRRLARFSAGRH